MDEKVSQLYDDLILEHSRSPLFFEKRTGAQYVIEANNPLCGDKFKLFLDVKDGLIEMATFHGYGCAVSKASASVLMTKIQGQPLDTLPGILKVFLDAVATGTSQSLAEPELVSLAVAKNFPGRDKCAMLAWEALMNWKLNDSI
ncbi:MAG: SUF system NifU family Fe-S cluster assembly protein [Saprospiraceae bacterium]